MKRHAANLLLVLGLLLAGSSALVVYLARTVLDEEAFATRMVSALDRPAVSAFVAQEIADGVVATNRDLTGVRPIISAMAQSLVRSAAFRAIARRAAREAHALLFSKGAEQVILAMPDVGVMLRGALESVSPEIASRVPVNVRTAIEARMDGVMSSRVLSLLRGVATVRQFARSGVLAGLLLLALALTLAPRRRQALLDAGIGLLAISALLALIVPLGRAAVTGAIADPALRPVVGELWLTFVGGLRQWALGIGAVAAMAMAAVASVISPSRLRDLARRGLDELTGRQPTALREVLRLASLLVIGAFAVASPLDTLAAAAVIGGVLLLALTVYEGVALVAPAGNLARPDDGPLSLNPALALGVGTVLLVTAGLGAMAVAPRVRADASVAAAMPVLECNGAVALCARALDDITLVGAHNAMGAADNPRWMFPNQDVSIPVLLQKGVRALLLDVHAGHPVQDRIKTDFQSEDERRKYEAAIGPDAFAAAMRIRDRLVGEGGSTGLYMCHGFCELGATPFDTALAELRTFLVAHPGEVVLLVIEDYVPPAEIMAAFERQGLGALAYQGPWKRPLPTLGEMVERGQRLVVLGEHITAPVSWYFPAFDLLQETPYTFHVPGDFSCRPNRGDVKNPLFLMNHWIETTPAPRPSNAALVNTE